MTDDNEFSALSIRLEDVPEWVPPAVKAAARTLPVTGFRREAAEGAYEIVPVAKLLLTAPRMKGVWRYLGRQQVTPEALAALREREHPYPWGCVDKDFPIADEACAALFAAVVIEFCFERVIGTRKQAEKFAEPWREAAKLCWRIMCHEPRPVVDTEFAQALAMVGEYFEDGARMRAMEGSPYIVERSSALRGVDDEIRARALVIARKTNSLWGKTMPGVVARVLSVGWDTVVTRKMVENWLKARIP
jgi:hypothetical protein